MRHPNLTTLPSLREELESTERHKALLKEVTIKVAAVREEYALDKILLEQIIITAKDINVELVRIIRASYKIKQGQK
jgi:hypothetical protein